MTKRRILIADNLDSVRDSLVNSPILNKHFTIVGAKSGQEVLDIVARSPDLFCIILEQCFCSSGRSRLKTMRIWDSLVAIAPQIPIIISSDTRDQRKWHELDARIDKVFCFLNKPFKDSLLLQKLHELTQHTEATGRSAQRLLASQGFISASSSMALVCRDALIAARSNLNIMIIGETGTGKTSLARAMHAVSNRADQPFVIYNCGEASGDRTWLKDDLCGHAPKAYNGAVDKQGLLRLAGSGSILLDDITEMPLGVQAGLLQVIQHRRFRRLGGNREHSFTARIMAATSLSLSAALREKKLREDLRYRLCGEIIRIPPLRNRPEDIPALVQSFLNSPPPGMELGCRMIAPEAISVLQRQAWIGNIRQLEFVLLRASVHERSDTISTTTVKEQLAKENGPEEDAVPFSAMWDADKDLESTVHAIRRNFIRRALRRAGGEISGAAASLGYANHSSLRYWLGKYGIEAKEYR